jgi:hypothetical protein
MPKTAEAALVVAQAYLFTTQPTPGDPHEGMHWAALQGLGMVGNMLKRREEAPQQNRSLIIAIALGVADEPEDPGPRTRKYHHAIATARGTTAGGKDPGIYITTSHHGTIIA